MITVIPFADHEIGFECIKYLLKCEKEGKLKIPFIVTTQSNDKSWWPSLKEFSNYKEIKVFEGINSFEDFLEIDYFLLLSWKYFMKEKWLSIPRCNTINLHYSLLPKYRGTNPVNWAMINGEQTTGITFHEVNSKLDEGRIISQAVLEIKVQYSLKQLLSKLNVLAFEQFQLLIEDLQNNSVSYTKQSNTNDYYAKSKLNKLMKLDLDHVGTLREHLNLLKGLSFDESNPMAYITIEDNKKLFFYLKQAE